MIAMRRQNVDLFPFVAPFVWLVLFPPPQASSESEEFPRTVLCCLTVVQTLYGYPVYGSQGHFIQILLIIVAAVCTCDSLRWITARGTRPAWFVRHGRTIATAALVVIAGVNLALAFKRYSYYRGLPSLNLPGAYRLHVDPVMKQQLASLTSEIDRSCDAFEGYPGLPSLNFWTDKEPLAGLSLDCWMLYFSLEQQAKIMRGLSAHPRACVVYNPVLIKLWNPGGRLDFETFPLVEYIRQEFKPVMVAGDYRLLVHKERLWVASEPQQGLRW
jgi:hypothetical protein